MSKTVNFAMFILGAAIGSVVTWKYVEHKYEQIAQDEIDSVKEVFSKRDIDVTEEDEDIRERASNAKEKPNIVEYAAKLKEQGYTNYSDVEPETKKKEEVNEEPMNNDATYVIPPEEFGNFEEYEQIGLTYYADQVLTDENDELVEDIEDTVGFDSLNHFGEYEDDSVFVRNDRLKCDYEILLDQRKYSDVVKKKPREVND